MEQFSLEKYLENPTRKVVTRSGHNVRILCTDQRGNMPIVALVEFETLDGVQIFYSDGKNESHREYDLFFADEEEELTEFEKKLKEVLYEYATTNTSSEEKARQYAPELLDLARKEVLKDLPKWKDVSGKDGAGTKDYKIVGYYLVKGDYAIYLENLENLPKEE